MNEVPIAGPKDYVKYTDQYKTRSHINFDAGSITIETISATNSVASLRQAIITTLLMGDDASNTDLYSDANDIQISREPLLYGQVLDNTGQPIRWEGRAASFADYLLQNRLQNAPPVCTLSGRSRCSLSLTIWTNVRTNTCRWCVKPPSVTALKSR